MRSAASSGAMVASSRAASASVRLRMNSIWCSESSSSKTSASSSRSWPDRLDDLLALFVRGGLDEVGDLGGMEPGQLAVGDAQARRGDVRHEWLDARPVDDLPGRDASGRATRGSSRRSATRGLGSTADDLPAAVDAGQLDLVGTDEPGALEVDQVPGAQVLATAGPLRAAARSA